MEEVQRVAEEADQASEAPGKADEDVEIMKLKRLDKHPYSGYIP